MARITPEDVDEVTDVDLQASDVQAFCDDAHAIVQQRVAPYADTDDQSDLARVETYLAAHMLTAKSPIIKSTSSDAISASYDTSGDGSEYWNRAILSDPTGRLARPEGWPVASTG